MLVFPGGHQHGGCKVLGRVVQSPIKLTQVGDNFDSSFVTFWCGVPFILFDLSFEL